MVPNRATHHICDINSILGLLQKWLHFTQKNESFSLRLFFQIFSDWSFRKFVSSGVFFVKKVSIEMFGRTSNIIIMWDGQVLLVRENQLIHFFLFFISNNSELYRVLLKIPWCYCLFNDCLLLLSFYFFFVHPTS